MPRRQRLADEVDLQTRNGVEEAIRERGLAEMQAAMRPMDEDQVG